MKTIEHELGDYIISKRCHDEKLNFADDDKYVEAMFESITEQLDKQDKLYMKCVESYQNDSIKKRNVVIDIHANSYKFGWKNKVKWGHINDDGEKERIQTLVNRYDGVYNVIYLHACNPKRDIPKVKNSFFLDH